MTYGRGSSAQLKLEGSSQAAIGGVSSGDLRVGDESPLHVHSREDETVYLMDGALTAHVGGQKFDVQAGSYAPLPKKVIRAITVRGE